MRTPLNRPLSVALLLSLCVALLIALSGPVGTVSAASTRLTNGCAVGPRGIPSCGAYVGAAYGGNASVTSWEKSMGKKLGVHRTYWGAGSVASAVKTAKADAANHRVPWMSFKAPHSWKDMAAGKGDAWAKSLATKMRAVPGPVWVAVVHEPENDGGDIQQWKKMQARLAPIMRKAAPNLAYSIILMGYHEFHGASKYRMSAIWPNTKIDVAGFDIYETYGAKNNVWKAFNANYFVPIQRWAQSQGVRWGLAETAYSDPAAKKNPAWIPRIYQAMKAHGGIAFSYFNTTLNSTANWKLGLATKKSAFTRVNKPAPMLR
jgi:hypothetical protein